MPLADDLIAWGPAVTVVLTLLLLSKELLDSTPVARPRLKRGLTFLIVPLFALFVVQVVLLVLGL